MSGRMTLVVINNTYRTSVAVDLNKLEEAHRKLRPIIIPATDEDGRARELRHLPRTFSRCTRTGNVTTRGGIDFETGVAHFSSDGHGIIETE